MTVRVLPVVRLLGLLLALAAYWAPWVAHPSAGLAIAEIDFNEFPKFMPQLRSGELEIWREAFYLTLLGPAVALAVWAALPRRSAAAQTPSSSSRPLPAEPLVSSSSPAASLQKSSSPSLPFRALSAVSIRALLARELGSLSLARWLVRLFALGLTLTPSIFNVFESGEFQTQLRLFAIVAVLILSSPLIRRLPRTMVALLLAACFVACALLPAREFLSLLPALAAIYNRAIVIGWGFYAALIGFALLVVAELSAAVSCTFFRVKS